MDIESHQVEIFKHLIILEIKSYNDGLITLEKLKSKLIDLGNTYMTEYVDRFDHYMMLINSF